MHYTTKSMLLDAVRNLPRTIYNLVGVSRVSVHETQNALIRNFVLSMPKEEQSKYGSECKFVLGLTPDQLHELMFPYAVRNKEGVGTNERKIESGRDGGLPYVVHGSGRKVYFPSSTKEADMVGEYRKLMYVEGITGAGCLEKSPHCYQDAEFHVEQGECLLDIGCAEALFAVDNIEKVKKAILFECEPFWQRPLNRTFLPYRDRVKIVRKMVSDRSSRNTTRIIDAVGSDSARADRFFVKMDVEGCERMIIKGNEDFFRNSKVKLSCCVYHRQDDGAVIRDMLERLGYKTRFSAGYMLVGMNGVHYPYFRHGVIYARNY